LASSFKHLAEISFLAFASYWTRSIGSEGIIQSSALKIAYE